MLGIVEGVQFRCQVPFFCIDEGQPTAPFSDKRCFDRFSLRNRVDPAPYLILCLSSAITRHGESNIWVAPQADFTPRFADFGPQEPCPAIVGSDLKTKTGNPTNSKNYIAPFSGMFEALHF